MCQGSSYRFVSHRSRGHEMELLTKINEEIRYKPVVAAIEITMFLKSEFEKTSETVRPLFSRPWIPLTAINMAANWRMQHQDCSLDLAWGVSSQSYNSLE